MKCLRCGGYLSYDQYVHDGDRFDGYRCLICGEILDSLIIENRIEYGGRDAEFWIALIRKAVTLKSFTRGSG